ncbi:NAD-dependent DNA ligase LigA [Mycoplasma nasistruthionis]|uniref:DNA ligase n=1 Tax=Mycoplasma nasistruthionis TaxID=353852 RepID=A0A5B7XW25_9MOLU|nr:NAD-dependent DNA ligase LigA [Mycoplasma nasistruthionis]QCZ36952.1 DNA ligase (NAD(+)) LigA [Mycoplasma nasistruthionis]
MTKPMTKKQQSLDLILTLTQEINKLNHAYYDLDQPLVDDYVYDLKLRQLEDLERKYPDLIQPDSPTVKIGGVPSLEFSKYRHERPMLSLAKAYSLDEVAKFIDDTIQSLNDKNISFNLEPKIDGLSLTLHYNNGKLQKAITRGNGQIGEDVTKNARLIKSIPKHINYSNSLEIRGEIYISKTQFELTNSALRQKYEQQIAQLTDQNEVAKVKQEEFANTRNMAAGTLRQKNGSLVAERNLQFLAYDIVDPEKHNLTLQSQIVPFLNNLGFQSHDVSYNESELNNIFKRIENFESIKNSFEYDCDGFVIKLNQLQYWDSLGKTAKFPKYAIAFKYKTEEAYPIITNILTTVGRTGKITYVAEFDKVELNQTMVQKATLHNYDFIENLNLNIGDQVVIIKSGEIIPKIIELKQKLTQGVFDKTTHCPICNSPLVEYPNIVDQFCDNINCPGKVQKNFIHAVSRNAFNILTLGTKNIETFLEQGYLTDLASIFELEKYKEQMLQLPSYQDKKVNGILDSIQEAKNIELPKALYALGIKNIGKEVAILLTNKINKLSDFIDYDFDSLLLINSIGPEIVSSLKEYFSDEKNIETIKRLDSHLKYIQNQQTDGKLSNLTFVISGTLSVSRNEMSDLIEKNGGKVASSISKNVNYLLCGENVGEAKISKAQKLNIPTISEVELLDLIK